MSVIKHAKDFEEIFAGLKRSGGRYVVPSDAKPDASGKVLGRAWTSHDPIGREDWEAHLSGKVVTVRHEETNEPLTGSVGLGVVPIREDNTAVFGAIDVDVYPLDLEKLLARVRELGLPLVICRTKSGGAHAYLFLRHPAPASLIRERLQEWSVALSYPGVEVFPKQTMISEHSDGSWINVPYSGGDRSVRYALDRATGRALSVAEFVEAVRATAVAPDELRDFELPEEETATDLDGAPPCLRTLARIGFGDWQNNSVFNLAVYARLRYGEVKESVVAGLNEKYISPPLGGRDVASVIKSVKKKGYFYKCKDHPIVGVCNRAVCLKAPFGVGNGAGDAGVVFGEMLRVVTDPVTWVWSIDGAEIEFSTDELMDQRRFRKVVLERSGKLPNSIKPDEWAKTVRGAIDSAKEVRVPEDGTREGQLWSHLANFCTARAKARTFDEILTGKAYTDKSASMTYFRSTDLFAYLAAHRFSIAERDVWRTLRRRGALHEERTVKGKKTKLWVVPAFSEQTEDHDVPRSPSGPEM